MIIICRDIVVLLFGDGYLTSDDLHNDVGLSKSTNASLQEEPFVLFRYLY